MTLFCTFLLVVCASREIPSQIEVKTDAQQSPISELPASFNRIALLVAHMDEATHIIKGLNLMPSSEFSALMHPMQVYSNANQSIFVICNGIDTYFNVNRIGTQAAAINAFVTIQHITPDLIMSVGISGAIVKQINDIQVNIGDVFIANKVMYHDRRIDVKPWSDGWGIGMYYTLDIFAMLSSEKQIKYLKTNRDIIVSTGNAFPECTHDYQIWDMYGAHLTEMEAAAIAEVCREKDVYF
eukprot:142041_1